jgi:membrane protease YdiL (CAAX protease family)
MPTPLDHILFVVLAVLFPLRAGTFGFRRLRLASEEDRPRARRGFYRQAMVLQWTLALATLALWIAARRPWASLGFLLRLNAGLIGIVAGMAIIAVVIVRQRRAALADGEALAKLRQRTARLEVMLPHSREELKQFFALSVTAGVCEELLYRGYLIWYLAHWLGLFPAAGLAAVIFGVGHAYQGWKGILTTALVGAFLGGVYIVSGSLYAGMLIHALMDAHSGHLMQAAYERAADGAAGVERPGDGASTTAEASSAASDAAPTAATDDPPPRDTPA